MADTATPTFLVCVGQTVEMVENTWSRSNSIASTWVSFWNGQTSSVCLFVCLCVCVCVCVCLTFAFFHPFCSYTHTSVCLSPLSPPPFPSLSLAECARTRPWHQWQIGPACPSQVQAATATTTTTLTTTTAMSTGAARLTRSFPLQSACRFHCRLTRWRRSACRSLPRRRSQTP